MGRIGDTVYDDDACELFCYAMAIIRSTCRDVESKMGPSYAAEYRRQVANVIVTDGDPLEDLFIAPGDGRSRAPAPGPQD